MFQQEAVVALRRLGASVFAGALAGVVVGGIGGRLAMMLLAVVNPSAKGIKSDDGFEIGRLTLSGSLNLLIVGLLLGAAGGAIYNVVRVLRFGPRWFQIPALAIGPGVVVGSMLVHTDGVDFTVLRPVWLSVGLFVLIPALYGALVTVLAERWLDPDSKAASLHPGIAIAPVVLVAPIAPLAALLIAGWLFLYAVRQLPWGEAAAGHPAFRAAGRVGLGIIFAVAAVGLVRDVTVLA
ncbi:MAG: hypothetical protein ACLGHT_02090 [Acidimicrobiia bacterium]